MRPTYLKFRSPKEKTGEYCIPQTTYQGTTLSLYKVAPKNKSTFPRSQRFEHIAEVSRRTSYRVGPGAYDFRLSTNKSLGPKMVREGFVNPTRKFEYFYVGDSIVRQERPVSRDSRSLSNSRNNHSFAHGTHGRNGIYRDESIEKRDRQYESSRRPHSSQEQRLLQDYDADGSGHKKKVVKDFYNYSGVKTKPTTSHLDEVGMYGSREEVRRSLDKSGGAQRPASVQKMRGDDSGNNDIRKEIINKVFVTYDKH